MTTSTLTPIALTIPDAVAYSGLSRSKLYELLRQKEIPSLQVGGRRLVLRAGIDALFQRLSEANQ